MPASVNIKGGNLVSYSIKVGGSNIPDTTLVYSIDVTFSVNRIAIARVVILDGDPTTGSFKESSSNTLVPGAELAIEAGYDSKNTLIFKGIIVSQNIRVNNLEGSVLEILCHDKAIETTIGRKSMTFSNKTDGDIIRSILGNYSSINQNVSATAIQYPQMVQYYSTDWDFILSRAEANGLIITNTNGKVSVINPIEDKTSVLELTYGNDIIELNGDLNSVDQLGKVKASSWDYRTQAIISGESSNNYAGAGNISSKKLSEVIGLNEFELQTPVTLNQEELSYWSKTQMIKSQLSKFCGEVTCQGNNQVLPGNFITLRGLGDRFNGDHFVSEVVHTISEGNWITEISFGLSPKWFTETPDIMAPPASGLLPGVNGLFTATVKKIVEDPENQYRILVSIPLFDASGEGLWARHGSFYASNNAGAFFLPEIGDEVIVGFLNEDPRFPIILGSLYSSEMKKPFSAFEPNEKNSLKGIVTKSGMQLMFDDVNKVINITTPNKNTLILSDSDKRVVLQDQNNNTIVMTNEGVVIKSEKNITLESSENLTLRGTQGVTISSSAGDININGLNIKETAQVGYAAEGSATASVQAGAQLTLKGAMVMIN